MAAILAVLSTLVGLGATLMMVALLVAGMPNGSPAQLARIKMLMLGMALCGLIGLVGSIWAMVAGRHWLAAGIGVAPAAVAIGMFSVLLVVEA